MLALRNMSDIELQNHLLETEGASPTLRGIIDWDQLAKQYVPNRTGIDCCIRWLSEENPLINNDNNWTADEDKKLLQFAVQYKAHNWFMIAAELNARF